MTEPLIWAFDIGSRSIGWAVMRGEHDGDRVQPTGEVVDAGVRIHSGGVLDDTDGTTRHAVHGQVARSRRRLKRKKARRHELRAALGEAGFELQEGWRPRNPWWARTELVSGPILEPDRVSHLVATALPHMAKHRGWRNPWVRAPEPNTVDPKKLEDVAQAATELSAISDESVPATLGAVSWALLNQTGPIKVRQSSKDDGEGQLNLNRWVPKVVQEHIAAELAEIWRVQRSVHPDLFTDESLRRLCEIILHQVKPGVPLERVGKCDIQPQLYRAPKASPIFQRYRLLDVTGNLRLEMPSGDRDRLTEPQRETVFDLLNQGKEISWAQVEEALDAAPARLVHADRKGTAGRPPTNLLAERLGSVKGISKLRKWWKKAGPDEREALVAMAITDLTFAAEQDELAEAVAHEMEDLNLLEQVERFGRSLPPGRASFSRMVLADLSEQMAKGSDLHDALERTYGYKAAALQVHWDDPIPNTGVELSMKEVRTLVNQLEREYGTPEVIGVEIVREASMSHSQRRDRNQQIERGRNSRREAKQVLVEDLGHSEPSPALIAKQEHITAQGGICLYCGDKLLVDSTDLDHIVPRKTGGATVFNNLAAVCRPCNHTKGNRPFGRWGEDDGTKGEKRMEETLARLDHLSGSRWKPTPTKPYFDADTRKWVYSEVELARRDYRRRLKKTSWDREFDDAEIHSTAFIGRAVTARLRNRYPEGETRVEVFRGGFTAAMRNETKLPRRLGLGEKKDREDRRHHAMDAIALALLTNPTWASRVRRRNEAFQNSRFGLISAEKLEETRLKAPLDDLETVMETVEATGAPAIDQIVPVLPKRLATTGRIHEDTVRPWRSRAIGEAWNAKQISSVRDQQVARALWRLSSSGGSVKGDPERTLELENGTILGPDEEVECAIKVDPAKGKETPVATWLPVREGWAKTDEIHHALELPRFRRHLIPEVGRLLVKGVEYVEKQEVSGPVQARSG